MNQSMKHLSTLLLAAGLSAAGSNAYAMMESEGLTGNNTFATADMGGTGTFEIHGDISPVQDVDIWSFGLAAGSTFSVNSLVMYMTYTGVFDINLVLFNSAGQSVASNSGNLNNAVSDLFSYNVGSTGTYFLTVSAYQNTPLDAFGNDLGDSNGYWYEATTFDSWSGDAFGSGHYGLQITAVPEAETYAMMLAGLGLVGWSARRRTRNA
jgi:hypothetical protein